MSTSSGIGVSADLAAAYATAIDSRSVRFMLIGIQNGEASFYEAWREMGANSD